MANDHADDPHEMHSNLIQKLYKAMSTFLLSY